MESAIRSEFGPQDSFQLAIAGDRRIVVGSSGRFPGFGNTPAGCSAWKMELDGHGLQAWRVKAPNLEVDQLRIMDDGVMREYLEQRIAAIQDRTGNLNIVRDYRQLQNPGFEVEEGTTRIFGWQVRKGPLGTVVLDTEQPHAGNRALRLLSEDRVGVAVQSHLFPIPETGQLVLGAYFRPNQLKPDARLPLPWRVRMTGELIAVSKAFPQRI